MKTTDETKPCYYRNSSYELVVTDEARVAATPQNVFYDTDARKWRAFFQGICLGTYPSELYAKVAYFFARKLHPFGWEDSFFGGEAE